jgi:hypothetical protein
MRYAVFYRTTSRVAAEMFKPSIPNYRWFMDDWRFMGVMVAADLDELFHNLNEPSGENSPLDCSHPDGKVLQNTVVRMAGHTSMSVGDIAIEMDSGKAYICASCGWDLVPEITELCGGIPR